MPQSFVKPVGGAIAHRRLGCRLRKSRGAHAAAWPGHSVLATVQTLLRQALEGAHRSGVDGVELSAVMSVMLVSHVEGASRVHGK